MEDHTDASGNTTLKCLPFQCLTDLDLPLDNGIRLLGEQIAMELAVLEPRITDSGR